ncbi:hypothetical protein M5689_015395 [Euphorbia peplus]|nr:hypothetical protein M5689_015395 [Euphorbia peplus]
MAFIPGKILILLLICSVSLKLMEVDGKEQKVCSEKLGNFEKVEECEDICKEGCFQRRSTYPSWGARCFQDGNGPFYCLCNYVCN